MQSAFQIALALATECSLCSSDHRCRECDWVKTWQQEVFPSGTWQSPSTQAGAGKCGLQEWTLVCAPSSLRMAIAMLAMSCWACMLGVGRLMNTPT